MKKLQANQKNLIKLENFTQPCMPPILNVSITSDMLWIVIIVLHLKLLLWRAIDIANVAIFQPLAISSLLSS